VGGCGGSVVVKIPDELDELDGYDREKIQERKEVRECSPLKLLRAQSLLGPGTKLEQEYANLIVQGHGENCPWRNKGCDGSFRPLDSLKDAGFTDVTQLRSIDCN
jgi:hypothetical protein